MALPKFIAIKSVKSNKYLRFIDGKNVPGLKTRELLTFSEEEAVSPFTKFEVEPAKSGDEGLVHLKCCYNNKYLATPTDEWTIAAVADRLEEDRSKEGCTLFKPIINGEAKTIQFLHVQSKYYALSSESPADGGVALLNHLLVAGHYAPNKDLYDVFTITDWESLVQQPSVVAMLKIPKFFAIKSVKNNKYLHFIKENNQNGVQMHGLLKFSGEELVSPFTKFQSEPTKSGGDGLVHIKCCYNNKYFVRRSGDNSRIAAAANQPEEDRSKWNCTLFKPIITDETKTVQFVHIQSGNYVTLSTAAAPFTYCFFAGSADKDSGDVFTITDWESLFVLPQHVAFKSDYIGKYLIGRRMPGGEQFLLFVSDEL